VTRFLAGFLVGLAALLAGVGSAERDFRATNLRAECELSGDVLTSLEVRVADLEAIGAAKVDPTPCEWEMLDIRTTRELEHLIAVQCRPSYEPCRIRWDVRRAWLDGAMHDGEPP